MSNQPQTPHHYRFDLVNRINEHKPITMRCCGCEKTVDQIPLIPMDDGVTYLIKDDDLVNKRYVEGKKQTLGWTPYYCTNCESVRHYKTVYVESELEYVCVWEEGL